MVDVEALVIMMAMISSVSPSRQGARTEFLVPGIGFLVVATQRTCFAKSSEPPRDFSSRRSYRRKGRARRCWRRPDATQARPGVVVVSRQMPRGGLSWGQMNAEDPGRDRAQQG